MKRLAVRLVVSHALVAVIATLACVVVVHRLAPAIFDESLRMGFGRGMPPGFGPGVLRGQVAEAVDRAMLVGTVLGVLAATAFGAVAATALTRPLARLRLATRQLAEGRYDVPVTAPATRELADLADDITTLASALADTEARRVRLLGDVAHELRTPLTVVDGYVEGMIDGVIPTTAEELARVGAEVARLRRLADDLSNLSRVAEGRVPLRLQMVDLRDVVVAAAKRLHAQAEDAGLTLDVDGGAAPLLVLADPDRIGQVVGNLVGNAIRATPSGGRVSVRTARRRGGVLGDRHRRGRGRRRPAPDLRALLPGRPTPTRWVGNRSDDRPGPGRGPPRQPGCAVGGAGPWRGLHGPVAGGGPGCSTRRRR
jgi:histidine kinase